MAVDPTQDILDAARESLLKLYEDTLARTVSIKHVIRYRSVSGRLAGYIDDGRDMQLFQGEIDQRDDAFVHADVMGETIMAITMERYDAFGPFHQYPNTFFVGPSQFSGVTGALRVTAQRGAVRARPYARDVDQIVWLKRVPGPTERYVLARLRLLRGRLIPGTLLSDLVVWESIAGPGDGTPIDVKQDAADILDRFFEDGTAFELDSVYKTDHPTQSHHTSREVRVSPVSLVLGLAWTAQEIARDRYSFPEVGKLPAGRERNMLSSALIGHMGYVLPSDADQSTKPVSVGKIDTDRLVRVLNALVVTRRTNATVAQTETRSNDDDSERDVLEIMAALETSFDLSEDDLLSAGEDVTP